MVKPLSFKGDKKPSKKRKRHADEDRQPNPTTSLVSPTNPAAGAEPDEDENWVSADSVADIAGPVMLVVAGGAGGAVSCIAADVLGAVFASAVENMVDGSGRTAEPHDVRQVWVAQGIVGMPGRFTFKAHSGRYLSADAVGGVSAGREAVGREETWEVVEKEEGVFEMVTGRGGRVGVEAGSGRLRADGEEGAAVWIRMQARFKPAHKVEKAEKVRAKVSRKELEEEVGRRLEDGEVKMLKKARREGNYHEAMLDVKVKGKHDKFA